jgi:hypothetical protein
MATLTACNIGPRERRKRLIVGLISFGAAFGVRFFAGPGLAWFYPLQLLFLFFGFLGTLQAFFCT